jgi:type IV secretory pathway VirB10-like protein
MRQCRERYKSYLAPHLSTSEWTSQEDQLLCEKYQQFGPKWVKIATFFTNRSDTQVKHRWTTLAKRLHRESEDSDTEFGESAPPPSSPPEYPLPQQPEPQPQPPEPEPQPEPEKEPEKEKEEREMMDLWGINIKLDDSSEDERARKKLQRLFRNHGGDHW